MTHHLAWSKADMAELKRRRGDNESFAQIARAMGKTRCAVAGKAYRMGLLGASRARPPKKFPEDASVSRCQYPEGEPGTDTFNLCYEAVAFTGSPYCAEHRKIAYRDYEWRPGKRVSYR